MALSAAQKEYQRLIGLRFGTVFAATVCVMWSGLFFSLLGSATQKVWLAAAIVEVGGVGWSSYAVIVRRPPFKRILPYLRSWAFWAKFYGIIIVESAVIFLAVRLLAAHHASNGTLPLIVFVVGAHFYPLAYWNGNALWYGTATVLCVSMVLLAVVVRGNATTTVFGAPHVNSWSIIRVGVMIVTMLVTALASSLMYVQRVSSRANAPQ